jgi:hypothetical protein
MKGEAAKEENIAPPWLWTRKESGKAVKEKFKAFATQEELNPGDRLAGVIQNLQGSHLPPIGTWGPVRHAGRSGQGRIR